MFFDWVTNIYQIITNWIIQGYNEDVTEYFIEPNYLIDNETKANKES